MTIRSDPPRTSATIGADAPIVGAGFGTAAVRYFTKYAVFAGRASRSEFWWPMLIIQAVGTAYLLFLLWYEQSLATLAGAEAVGEVDGSIAVTIAEMVVTSAWFVLVLAFIVPTLALYWRRLHDANLPGPLALVTLAPFLGGWVALFIGLQRSKREGARFDRPARP